MIGIRRLDPFGDLMQVRDRWSRVGDESSAQGDDSRHVLSRVWRPLVDVIEDRDAITVRLDLPGVQRESIDIQLTGDNLTVLGERKNEKPEGSHLMHSERPEGSFQRTFTLGIPVKSDGVEAIHRDGVLEIVLPKADTIKPKKVEVRQAAE